MDFTTILGFIAALFTTICNIPQAVKIIRTKETKGVSTLTYLALLTGLILWVVYGILRNDWPVIIANAISATFCAIVLILKLMPKDKLEKLHNTVHNN